MKSIIAGLLLGAGYLLSAVVSLAGELVMVEEQGCYWCQRWDTEISHIYPKTTEGKSAPLRRVNIDDDLGAMFALKGSVHFTPTFILIEDGTEVGRIEGYPGEDFFWGLLERMLENAKDMEKVSG